jgi:hypothetical protein
VVLPYRYQPPPEVNFPVAWVGGPPQVPFVELIGTNGDVLPLTGDGLRGYTLQEERGIFAASNTSARMVEGAGEGARYDGSKTGGRTVDLKLDVKGDTVDDLTGFLRRLADVVLADQPAWLRVTPRNGGASDARWLPVAYNGGWDGAGSGFDHLSVNLALVSPEAHWLSVTAQSPPPWTIRVGKGLLSTTTPLFPVRLGQSQVLGAIDLNNPGDRPAYATWVLTGPGGPITVRPAPGARGFTVQTDLAPGESLIASRAGGPATLVDASTGEDRYDLFGPAPLVWLIPPRTSTAYVEVLNSTAGTAVELHYVPRYWFGA